MASFLVHHLLRDAVLRDAEAIAAVDAASQMSYAELDRRSDRVARALAAAGVAPRSRVGLAVDKSVDAVVAVYGVLKAGCAYVPIDPLSPPRRVGHILAACDIACVLISPGRIAALLAPLAAGGRHAASHAGNSADGHADNSAAGHADSHADSHAGNPGLGGQSDAVAPGLGALAHALTPTEPAPEIAALLPDVTVDAWDAVAGADPVGLAGGPPPGAIGSPTAVTELDLAYILHTSGSTGAPKGVAITHRAALAFVDMATDYFALAAADRLACHAPLHFDLSVFDLFCAAAAGARVVLMPPHLSAFPGKMAAWIDDRGITVWNSVPSAMTLMVDRGQLHKRSLATLRAAIFSGEVMPIRVLRALRERAPQAALYNVYGQTEANSSLCYPIRALPDDAAVLPIGTAFPNFEVFAVAADGRVLGPADAGTGAEGELYVRAATVAAGYFRDADRTAEKFVPDPREPVTGGRVYRTGDVVAIDAGGHYVFRGRADNLIKTRGYRVELGEVEVALLASAGVERAAVIAVPDRAIGNRLIGFVSPHQGHTLDPATLCAQLAVRVPAYMIPDPIHVRDALPHTSTGKIDRKVLRAELEGDPDAESAADSPAEP